MGLIVAIDGPAGAGKSTVARLAAQRLGFVLVDTGAIYRCVALAARQAGLEWSDEPAVRALLDRMDLSFRFEAGVNHVFLGGADVTEPIRSREVSRGASVVSAHPSVRAGLLELQRRLARAHPGGAVLEGRDIGTVVFPDAQVKFFLTASPEARARRRQGELGGVAYEEVLAEISARDHVDQTRQVAPLRPAPDARHLDTTGLTAEEVVARVLAAVDEARKKVPPSLA